MRKTIFFIIITLLGITGIFSDSKIEKTCFINIQTVIDNVFPEKSQAVKSLKDEKQKFQDTLDKQKEAILALEDEKSKEKDDAKKKEIDKKLEDAKKQYNDYYKTTSVLLDQKSKTVQQSLFKEIWNVVQKMANSNGYTTIWDVNTPGLFYYTTENDITSKVIDYIKKN